MLHGNKACTLQRVYKAAEQSTQVHVPNNKKNLFLTIYSRLQICQLSSTLKIPKFITKPVKH